MKPLVAYYRVSTQRQGDSGLGLEAQQHAVDQFSQHRGSPILRAFQEVETGKKSDRPELQKALAFARRAGATLVVAKLDRLSRNVAFTSALMESKVDFVACDNPSANTLTIHILAAVAENEAKAISDRTKAALAAYKARGGVLGAHDPRASRLSPEAASRGQKKGAAANRKAATAAYADLLPIIEQLRSEGRSFRQVAKHLNADGQPTRTGKAWTPSLVFKVLERAFSVI